MTTSLILSFSTCYIFSLASFFVWWYIVKNDKEKKFLSYGWAWFCAGGTVGFMGFRTMLFGFGFIFWDLFFAVVDQLFLTAFFVFAYRYFFSKMIKKRSVRMVFNLAVLSSVFLIMLFIFLFMFSIAQNVGTISLENARTEIIANRHISDWGSEFIPPKLSMEFFFGLSAILLCLLLFNVVKNVFLSIKENNRSFWYDVFFSLALFIFLVALIFDQRGTDAGWKLLFYRTFGMTGSLMAYLTSSFMFTTKYK